MSVKVYVGLATAGSIFVIIMSLVAVCVIYNDINNLYDDVMDEMGEFKVSTYSLIFILSSTIQMHKLTELIFANKCCEMSFRALGFHEPQILTSFRYWSEHVRENGEGTQMSKCLMMKFRWFFESGFQIPLCSNYAS